MKKKLRFLFLNSVFIFSIVVLCDFPAFSYPVDFIDAQGHKITIVKMPERVVSLVPAVTEIIFKIGAQDAVKGITYHDTRPAQTASKIVVGGFFSPSVNIIEKIEPDVIFISDLHEKVKQRFGNDRCLLIDLDADSLSDIYKNIELLGRIFGREKQAKRVVHDIKDELEIIAEKTAKIPLSKRKRVIRLMGRKSVMAPGDDSFQNGYIKLAGGIPPVFHKKGNVITVTKEEWLRFNPQVIFGCGGDRKTAESFLDRSGWNDVDAVKNGRIFYFPCPLTCRASTHAGYFVSWLSARIYDEEFLKKENQVLKDGVFKSKNLDIDIDYIKDARIAYSRIDDFLNKTLVIDFKKSLSVVSTLEGQRHGIVSVGNHYSPPPCWGFSHKKGLDSTREDIYRVVGMKEDTSSFLFTGADMDNLSICCRRFKKMAVYALVTAGVQSNAVRMSEDEGKFYEPGTINIILLANMKLTPRAMTRAIISATEAKTAALADMDIRSSYTPLVHQATGTGTDNIIVVGGEGKKIDNAGGHSKMGELIARSVYAAVQEAVSMQNSIVTGRNIFQRLNDRRISLPGLINIDDCECNIDKSKMLGSLEEILLEPRYAEFIKASFAISDDYEKGLVSDLDSFDRWCKTVADDLAGEEIEYMKDFISYDYPVPVVVKTAFNALLNGLHFKMVSIR